MHYVVGFGALERPRHPSPRFQRILSAFEDYLAACWPLIHCVTQSGVLTYLSPIDVALFYVLVADQVSVCDSNRGEGVTGISTEEGCGP